MMRKDKEEWLDKENFGDLLFIWKWGQEAKMKVGATLVASSLWYYTDYQIWDSAIFGLGLVFLILFMSPIIIKSIKRIKKNEQKM